MAEAGQTAQTQQELLVKYQSQNESLRQQLQQSVVTCQATQAEAEGTMAGLHQTVSGLKEASQQLISTLETQTTKQLMNVKAEAEEQLATVKQEAKQQLTVLQQLCNQPEVSAQPATQATAASSGSAKRSQQLCHPVVSS